MFRRIWEAGLAHYDDLKGIDLEWLCADGSQGKAPLGGKKSGPNPTDRGKRGGKRSVLCDGRGVVLGMVIEGANCPDLKLLPQTLECVPSSCKQRKRFEQASHLCLDKGYDCQALRQWLHQQGFIAHIPRRGQEPKPKPAGGKARRWVVERIHAWLNRYRRLLVRWEKKAANYEVMLNIADVIIVFQ